MGTLRMEIRRSFPPASAGIWNSLSTAAEAKRQLVMRLEVSEQEDAMELPATGQEISASPLFLCNCRTFS